MNLAIPTVVKSAIGLRPQVRHMNSDQRSSRHHITPDMRGWKYQVKPGTFFSSKVTQVGPSSISR